MDVPSFANPSELDDIRDDIEVHTVLLNSLDDDTDSDAEDSRKSIKRTLKRLKKRLKQLQPEPEPSTVMDQLDGINDEAASSRSHMPPPSFDLVNRKRQRNDLDDGPRQSKSQRQSPSTSATAAASPAPSADSSGTFDFDDPVLGSLLPGYSREEEANNKAYIAGLEQRKKQEQEDAELARRLQAEMNEEPGPSSSSSQRPMFPTTSSTQSFFRSDGTINRQLPRPSGMPPFADTPYSTPQYSKPEYKPSMPPKLNSLPSTPSDGDVEEISAQDFQTHYSGLNRLPQPAINDAKPPYGASMPGAFPGGPYGSVAGAHVYGAPIHGPTQYPNYGGSSGLAAMFNGALDALGIVGSNSNPYDVDVYNNFRDGFADPGKTEEDLKNLLKQIRPDEELSEEERSHLPVGLKLPLMKHQAAGVAWMKRMEESTNKGGILADDMGLGKTLQTIALMLARPPPPNERQPTLIVAPLALLRQWKEELVKFVEPAHRFSVLILHGPSRPTKWAAIKAYDVVITTYSTLAAELKRKLVFEEKRKMVPDAVPTGKEEYPLLGDRTKFHRVVLDEAQNVKNRLTKSSVAACQLNATHHWCLTGTPMQNSTDEMYSLIKFCRIPPYNSYEIFSQQISRPLKSASTRESTKDRAMERLQALLRGIMLRRNKKSEIDGQPIIQLPAKNTIEDRAHFDKDQLDFYQALESKAQIQFNKYLRAGTVGQNYSNALVLLLRLRQACCHPHLITNNGDFAQAVGDLANLGADFRKNAKLLKPDVVARLKQSAEGQEALECPVCMDANDNPVIFACGHAICNDCLTRLTDNVMNNDGEGSKATCPHCRAQIDATKITNLINFLKVHCPDDERVQDLPEEENADDVVSSSDDSSDDDDDSDDDDGDLRDFIVKDDEDVEYDTDASSSKKKGFKKKLIKESASNSRSSSKSRSKAIGKGKGKADKSKLKGKSLAELRKEGLKSKAAKKKYLKKLAKDYVPSAKIEKTIALLEEIRDRGEGEKTIVFSSFTSFLDLIEVPLAAHPDLRIYARYDGSMKRTDREDAVYRFKEDRNCKVMLVSLKAGNTGLNLTAANHVVILDPFWNPFVEYQAADRCYRIGQMREVSIHRILIGEEGREYGNIADGVDTGENNFTVEDRILKLQEKKKKLVEMALDERAGERIGRLGARELGYLFGVNSLD